MSNPRYRLHEASGVLHDTRTPCDNAHDPGNKELTFHEFSGALERGATPCRHCFRDGAQCCQPEQNAQPTARGRAMLEEAEEESSEDDKPKRGSRT